MRTSHVVRLFVLGAALLVHGAAPAAAQGKKGARKAQNQTRKAQDKVLIHDLRKTAHLLTKADRDYKGHRAAAVRHIKKAVHALTKEAKARGHKIPSAYKGPEPQPVSDAQLRQARDHLTKVLGQLKSLKGTKHRATAAQHVSQAIAELNTALKIA